MEGLAFIIFQCAFFLSELFYQRAFPYITKGKATIIYRISLSTISCIAVILEIIFFANVKTVAFIFLASLVVEFLIGATIDLICKKKFFNILKDRIVSVLGENSALKETGEIRRSLAEKYGEIYSLKDIEKVLKKMYDCK